MPPKPQSPLMPPPAERRAFWQENGYWVQTGAMAIDEVEQLRADAVALCHGAYGTFDGHRGNHDGQVDDQIMRQYLCIHFPHKVSPLMARTLAHPRLLEVLTDVIGPDVKCMQSMLFIKAAGKPGQAWHQDEDYIPTRDRSLTGAWIALDDATIDNGCLWVIPGSHRHGVLWPQFALDAPRFDCSAESRQFPYSDDDAVPVEVPAGSVVYFNGSLLHRSLPNSRPGGYRRALVNHYMSAQSLLPWRPPREGEHMAVADDRDIVLVAGRDPYAWKGTENHRPAYVRPSGEGGCDR